MLSRVGSWCRDRRRLVLALWIAALILGNGVANGIGDNYRQDFSLSGFESTAGFDLVKTEFNDGSQSPASGQPPRAGSDRHRHGHRRAVRGVRRRHGGHLADRHALHGRRVHGGPGITASLTVAVTVLASITLLPALIGFAGDDIERTKWRGLLAAGFVALGLVGAGPRLAPLIAAGFAAAALVLIAGLFVPALQRQVEHRPPPARRDTIAYQWSRVIQHRPWTAAFGAAAVLVVLAIPVANLRLGFSDESNAASNTSTKRAYNLVSLTGIEPGPIEAWVPMMLFAIVLGPGARR